MAKILSIEIDNRNTKIIVASKKGKILSVFRCISVDFDHGVKDGKIINMSYIAKEINEVFKMNNIKTRKTVFVINSSSIMIRTIRLPLLKKASEILSMIEIELQQTMSADLSKYKISYEISKVISENKIPYALYVVYCIPIILVNQYVELAEKLNLKLLRIDTLPNCVNSLCKNVEINGSTLSIKDTTAFINLKENLITFYVASDGFCDFYISSEFDRKIAEIAAESQSPYMYSDLYSSVAYTRDDSEIIYLIAKFIRYYYSVSGNRTINKIYIWGNYALETKNKIKSNLNLDSEILGSISNIKIDEKCNEFELNKYFYTVLTLFSENKDTSYNRRKKNIIRNNYGKAAILLVIVVASIVLFGFINSQVSMRNKILAMTSYVNNENIRQNNNEIVNIKEETEYLDQYLKQAEKLQDLIKSNDCVDSNVLRNINMSKPSETKVTSIYLDKDSMQLQCLSPSMNEATLFFSNLEEIKEIESIYMPAIQSKTEQVFSYSLILKLKDVDENEN